MFVIFLKMNGIRNLLKKSNILQYLRGRFDHYRKKDFFSLHAKVNNHGYGRYRKYISGNNNTISIGYDTKMVDTLFHILGNNNRIIIEDNCYIGKACSFWMEGNNITIHIGKGTTFTTRCHFNAQENNSRITVGRDCMFSNNIIVRTSDAHPIYDTVSGQRINYAKPVIIGDHVWIAPDTKIMKGAIIEDGCIIGSNSMVTNKTIPSNSLAVGSPVKVVKGDIKWTREDIIFS